MLRLICFTILSLLLAFEARAEERYALLIGNEAYDGAPLTRLKEPHQDVDRIRAALIDAGFPDSNIEVLKDANRVEMREAMRGFRSRLDTAGRDAVGFVYYSGHGAALELDGERDDYLIPTGERINHAEDVEVYGVALGPEVRRLARSEAKAIFVVVDACRNTLQFREKKAFASLKGVGRTSAPAGMLVAFAAADGEFAEDDALFSTTLADEIRKDGQRADVAFLNAANRVAAARPKQEPPVIQPRLGRIFCFQSCSLPERREPTTQPVLDTDDPESDDNNQFSEESVQGFDPVWDEVTQEQWSTSMLADFKDVIRRADRNAMETAASEGNLNAMVLVGLAHHFSFYPETDHGKELRDYILPACQLGHGRACSIVAWHYRTGISLPENQQIAYQYYQRSCNLGTLMGCHYAAIRTWTGTAGVAKDIEFAASEFERLCYRGIAYSCIISAEMWVNGDLDTGNITKGQPFLDEACKLGTCLQYSRSQ